MSHVFFNLFLEENDVIQADDRKFPSNQTKNDIYCALKHSWDVLEPKWHSCGSKKAGVRNKWGFILVLLVYRDLPITIVAVQGDEYLRFG